MEGRGKLIFGGGLVLLAFLVVFNFSQVLSLKAEVGEIKASLNKGFITPLPTVTKSEPIIEVVGLIQYSDIEGGCWYIDPNWPCQGDKCPLELMASYEPINLPKELQKTGLKAKFKLEVLPDVATICQIGPAVKILDYKIIK